MAVTVGVSLLELTDARLTASGPPGPVTTTVLAPLSLTSETSTATSSVYVTVSVVDAPPADVIVATGVSAAAGGV